MAVGNYHLTRSSPFWANTHRLCYRHRVAVVEVFETLGRQAFLDNRDKLTAADPRLLQAVDADEPYLRIQLDGPPLY
jgi:hypothetical protein